MIVINQAHQVVILKSYFLPIRAIYKTSNSPKYEHFQVKDLQIILGTWPWSNQLGEGLIDVLKKAYWLALTANIKTPAKRKRALDDSS
jgi:hypothetical protein